MKIPIALLKIIYNDPCFIRKFIVDEKQKSLLLLIGAAGSMTAPDVVKHENISIQCASNKLVTLYNKGYLARTNAGDPSGGVMYRYWLTDTAKKVIFDL